MAQNGNTSLSSAECAARTGLTVRALRVYERYGLIKPHRSPNGWRAYGPDELARLNTITVLKSVGLSLAEIRDVINEKAPSLQRILEMQSEAWKTKKADADRGLMLTNAALARLHASEALDIDELCQLVKSLEMSPLPTEIQKFFDRRMSSAEQREWRNSVVPHSPAIKAMQAYNDGQKTLIFPQLQQLIEAGVELSSPQVEALVDRNNQLMTEHKVREYMLDSFGARPALAASALQVGKDVLHHLKDHPTERSPWMPNPEVVAFLFKAIAVSMHRRKICVVLSEATQLVRMRIAPSAIEARTLIERLRQIGREHHLGDMLVYARWAKTRLKGSTSHATADDAPAWDFLISALGEQGPTAFAARGA